ncbi:hypothetical protein AK812_SmicGene36741 [Symbiodinium microadriaticum]|uniref:Uncharacterized protein n=1 Tax=Symbiodinium microadriaticum TaxID=2951 RepID=A0A1Q9CI50_SYMMI|nr:hypothetical protein AK812_SmicGene36741 [Symbiodinium microadriaticum]
MGSSSWSHGLFRAASCTALDRLLSRDFCVVTLPNSVLAFVWPQLLRVLDGFQLGLGGSRPEALCLRIAIRGFPNLVLLGALWTFTRRALVSDVPRQAVAQEQVAEAPPSPPSPPSPPNADLVNLVVLYPEPDIRPRVPTTATYTTRRPQVQRNRRTSVRFMSEVVQAVAGAFDCRLFTERHEGWLCKQPAAAAMGYDFHGLSRGRALLAASRRDIASGQVWQLDLPDLSAQITAEADRPEGCYFFEGLSLWLGVSPASKGKGAETSGPEANKTRHPICSSVVPDMRVATGLAGNGGAS